MGVLTLLDFREQLIVSLGGRSDRPNSELDQYVNMGYSLISLPEVRKHEQLKARSDIALVANTEEYSISKATLGFNILAIRMIEYFASAAPIFSTRRTKLDPRPLEWWSDTTLFSSSSGPRYYLRDGDTLRISPVPDTTTAGHQLRIHAYREPTPLALDTDTTVLDDYFDNAVILAAQYHAQFRLGYRELAINARQELQAYVNQRMDAGEADTDPGQRQELRHENPMARG